MPKEPSRALTIARQSRVKSLGRPREPGSASEQPSPQDAAKARFLDKIFDLAASHLQAQYDHARLTPEARRNLLGVKTLTSLESATTIIHSSQGRVAQNAGRAAPEEAAGG